MKSPSDRSPARGDAAAALRQVLEQARDFIDPDRDPPRINNRKLVMKINAVLSRVDAQGAGDCGDYARGISDANELVGCLWVDLFNRDLVKAAGADYFDKWRDRIKALSVPSTMRRGPCEVCGQAADLCMSSLSGCKTWICVMCDPDSPTVDASREDGK